jgi:hypothetical protein
VIPILRELLDGAELRRRGFVAAIALTYGVDLPWFEQHVGRQLRVAGVRRFAVFADARALDESLARDATNVEGAGTWYSIVGIRGAGAFHPKAILLTGPEAARLYVGSGNLNPCGLGRNLELFERWDASITDGHVDRVFEDFRRFIDQVLVAQQTPMAHVDETLRETFSQPVLRQSRKEGASRLYGAHVGAASLLNIIPTPSTPATKLVMTAPFFDAEGQLAVEIARRLKAGSFEVLVDVGMTNLQQHARQSIEAAGGVIRAFDEKRAVHAKAVVATGDGWRVALHGSANLSNAAWRGHNAELLIMNPDAADGRVAELLQQLATRDMTDQDWQGLVDAVPDEPAASDASLIINAATWIDDEHVELIVSNDDSSRELVLAAVSGARTVRAPAPRHGDRRRTRIVECRGNTLVVRLEDGATFGPWSVVHDPSVLRQHASPRSPFDAAVDQLEGRRSGDATQALLELLSAIADERREPTNVQARRGHAPLQPDSDAEHWVWVTAEDFADAAAEAAVAEPSSRDDGRPDPAPLLRRLVLGDPVRTDTVEIQDSSSGDPTKEPGRKQQSSPPPNLGKVVDRIQKAYLSRLRQPGAASSPARLLQELLVLVAAFQDAARQGSITDRQLATSLVALGDAVFAGAIFRSLQGVSDAQRNDVWQRAPVLAASALTIYNTCLINAVLQDNAPPDSVFSDTRPILWLRNVVRHAPSADPAWLLTNLEEHLVRIRKFSVLWIADRWPYFDQLLPFEEFVRDAVNACVLLERIDASLRSLPPPSYQYDDDDRVVGLGRDQRLAVGFRESEEEESQVKVLLFDGAFQKPGPQTAGEPRPHIRQTPRVRSLAQVRRDLSNAGWSPSNVDSALLLLGQLVDS